MSESITSSTIPAGDVPKQNAPDGYVALCDRLTNALPGETWSAEELAREYNLDEKFVRDVLASLQGPKSIEPLYQKVKREVIRSTVKSFEQTRASYKRITNRPIPFILSSSAIYLAIILFLESLQNFAAASGYVLTGAKDVITVAVGIFITVLHLLCYARHGRARFALIGTLSFTVIFAAAFYFSFFLFESVPIRSVVDFDNATEADIAGRMWIIMLVGTIFFAIAYGVMAMGATMMGAVFGFKRKTAQLSKLTRQELLDRYFKLNDTFARIRRSGSIANRPVFWIDKFSGKAGYTAVALLALAVYVSRVMLFGAATLITSGAQQGPVVSIAEVLAVLITLGAIGFAGLIGAGYRRGIVLASFYVLLASVFYSWPLGSIPNQTLAEAMSPDKIIGRLLLAVFIGGLTGIAGYVEVTTQRQRSLRRNDPAAVLGQMVMIQRRLRKGNRDTCVLVVDVAKSTLMKHDADPLLVEWSFREYQALLAQIAQDHGGEVISTAGDGAVITFHDCETALQAARSIQTNIIEFNNHKNRLEKPFRVRIGLHSGSVDGNLDEIQFNNVIDHAAHVQDSAPVGGIALTEAVLAGVPDEKVVELKEGVDGHKLFFVLNPTHNN